MRRGILIALTAGVILLAFAAFPPMLPGSTTLSLSGSALAATTINTTRSNTFRMGGGGGVSKKQFKTKQTGKKKPPP